jgi:hypothetical protein
MDTDNNAEKDNKFKTPNLKQTTRDGSKTVAMEQKIDLQSPLNIAQLYSGGLHTTRGEGLESDQRQQEKVVQSMIMGAERQVADSQVLINDQVQISEGQTWDETE